MGGVGGPFAWLLAGVATRASDGGQRSATVVSVCFLPLCAPSLDAVCFPWMVHGLLSVRMGGVIDGIFPLVS